MPSLSVTYMSNLTPKHLEALSLLSSGFTQAETARKLKVSERTIQRWAKIPEFAEALKDVKQKATQKTIETTAENINKHVKKLIPKAIKTLENIIDDNEAQNNDKLRALETLEQWTAIKELVTAPEDWKTCSEMDSGTLSGQEFRGLMETLV